MTPQELDQSLRTLTESEKQYRTGKADVWKEEYMRDITVNGTIYHVLDLNLFTERPFLVGKKHTRFRKYPLHIHQWVEIVYMYSGSCTQKINGKPIRLEQGQILMLDQNVVHEIPVLDMDQIMLNIIVDKKRLIFNFLNRISQRNIVSQFLINSITEGMAHNDYIFFASENSRRIPLYIREFFCEVFSPCGCHEDILSSLLTLILIELIQVHDSDSAVCELTAGRNTSVLPILKYIETHYQKISLKETADTFHVSSTYLSELLKTKTGNSFRELVYRQRMLVARQMLLNSDLSISEIARKVGYENTSFFHKKFKAYTGCSPAEYRNIELQKSSTE